MHLHVESEGWWCTFRELEMSYTWKLNFCDLPFKANAFEKVWRRAKGGYWHKVEGVVCSLYNIGMQFGQGKYTCSLDKIGAQLEQFEPWSPPKGWLFSHREKRWHLLWSKRTSLEKVKLLTANFCRGLLSTQFLAVIYFSVPWKNWNILENRYLVLPLWYADCLTLTGSLSDLRSGSGTLTSLTPVS